MNKRQTLKALDKLVIKVLMEGKDDKRLRKALVKDLKSIRKDSTEFDKATKENFKRLVGSFNSSQQNQP